MSELKEKKRGGSHLAPKADKPPKQRVAKAKKPDTRTKKEIIRHRTFIALTVAAAIIVILTVAYKLLVVRPEVPSDPTGPNVVGEDGKTDVNPHATSGRKNQFYTFLIVGRDTGGGGNTDTMLLAAYDVPNQKLNVMSLPRDTMINVSWDTKKLNSVYPVYGKGEKGIQALNDEIAELVGFRPDFQVVVEWKAVGELVEALGGVTYDVPFNMDYEDPTQSLSIHVKKGVQKLNGKQAMGVVRFRKGANGYANGDLGRIETQQEFLKAVVKQCLTIQNMGRIGDLAKVFTDNVTTGLTINNLAWFAQQAIFGGLKMENVNFITMPCTGALAWSRGYSQHQSYVVPNTEELVALVNEHFNPYKETLDKSELDIMYVNKDGTIASSTGKLQDTKANPAWLNAKNTPKSTAKPAETTPIETPAASASVSPSTSPSVSPGTTLPQGIPVETPPVVTDTPAASPPPATQPPVTPPQEVPSGPPEGIPTF